MCVFQPIRRPSSNLLIVEPRIFLYEVVIDLPSSSSRAYFRVALLITNITSLLALDSRGQPRCELPNAAIRKIPPTLVVSVLTGATSCISRASSFFRFLIICHATILLINLCVSAPVALLLYLSCDGP